MQSLLQNTATPFTIFVGDSTKGEPKLGLSSFTVTLAKDGGTAAAVTPTITELSGGRYAVTPETADRDTIGVNVWSFAASGASTAKYSERVVNKLPALDVELADAVVERLQAVVLSETGAAIERKSFPRFTKSELDTVRIVVAPLTREKATTGRNACRRNYYVQIGVLQNVKAQGLDRDARVDELIRLVESIDDALETAPRLAGCTFLESTAKPLFDADALDEGLFRAVLTATYQIEGRPVAPVAST